MIVKDPLPSPYLPHPCGLMHLPRMLEKIRRHWRGVLTPYYARTLGRGFDDLLCEHLEIPFDAFMEVVRRSGDSGDLEDRLARLLPADVRAPAWNRKLVQRGLTGYSRERLDIRKRELNLTHRHDILTMCDLLEVAEGRLP